MSYGKITQQELSKELRDLIQKSGSGLEFISKGNNQVERKPGTFYLVEVDDKDLGELEAGRYGRMGVEIDPKELKI